MATSAVGSGLTRDVTGLAGAPPTGNSRPDATWKKRSSDVSERTTFASNLKRAFGPHMPQLVAESPRLGGRIACRDDETEIRVVGPAELRRFLRFVLGPRNLDGVSKTRDQAYRQDASVPPIHNVLPSAVRPIPTAGRSLHGISFPCGDDMAGILHDSSGKLARTVSLRQAQGKVCTLHCASSIPSFLIICPAGRRRQHRGLSSRVGGCALLGDRCGGRDLVRARDRGAGAAGEHPRGTAAPPLG